MGITALIIFLVFCAAGACVLYFYFVLTLAKNKVEDLALTIEDKDEIIKLKQTRIEILEDNRDFLITTTENEIKLRHSAQEVIRLLREGADPEAINRAIENFDLLMLEKLGTSDSTNRGN